MRENFEKIKTSLCEACSLYIPSDQGEFAIYTDASDHGIGAVLEQKEDQGNWCPCAFFSRNLHGSVKYDADGKVLGCMGQRAWSVTQKETYALVSCLSKFKARYQGARTLFSLSISPWSHCTKKSFVPWLVRSDLAAGSTNFSPGIRL